MQLHDLTLTELAAGLAAKRFSSREIVDSLLGRIAKANDKLHAFTEVYATEAKALAQAADTARASGFPLGPLHGLPVAYKDLCDIAGKVGTGGSKMFETRVATETSNTVERLTAAGMVPLGKLHMVEFAFGGWGTNPLMGAPWNPWDLKTHRVPGGSSSGTGVAVAARLAPAGIGSDTGGSVRIPSAFNGLVGLKVTFGRIGLSGTMLLSWTLDSIGPMARSVEDCALMLNALAAPDPRDPTTLDQPLEDFTLGRQARLDRRHARGHSRHQAVAELHAPRCHQGLADGRPDLREPGRHGRGGADARLVFRPVAAGRNDHRLGGLLAASRLHREHEQGDRPRRPHARADGEKLPGRRLCRGDARHGRSPARLHRMDEALRCRAAADHGRAGDSARRGRREPRRSRAISRGRPTISACAASPCRSGQSGGLPIGIQIVGKPFAERDVLRLGKAFQDATDFHRLSPDLTALGL